MRTLGGESRRMIPEHRRGKVFQSTLTRSGVELLSDLLCPSLSLASSQRGGSIVVLLHSGIVLTNENLDYFHHLLLQIFLTFSW